MKLAIVSRGEIFSGKEIMTLELGTGMRSAGHEVGFVSSPWNDGTFQSRLARAGFAYRLICLGSISATLTCGCLWRTLVQVVHLPGLWADYRRFLQEEKPDRVIHTSWHHLMLLWPFLTPRLDWFWIHEILPNKWQYRFVFRRLARSLIGFVAVSQAVADSLRALGIPPSKIRVIYNGLRDPRPAGANAKALAHRLRIGIVGQVQPWKGHHDLLAAFALIAPRHPTADVHIFGTGSETYTDELRKQADRLGLTDRVHWHGFVDDRVEIYQHMDVCAVPSRTPDPLPTVAIEAGFFNLPVVAYRSGGLPEIIDDKVSGFLAEPGNVAQLAECLSELLADPGKRQTMGAAGRAKVETLSSRERFVMEFVNLMAEPAA